MASASVPPPVAEQQQLARGPDGRFLSAQPPSDAPPASAPPASAPPVSAPPVDAGTKRKFSNPVELLQDMQSKLGEQHVGVLEDVAEYIAEMVEGHQLTSKQAADLRAKADLLQENLNRTNESSKTVVKDIVTTLSDLFKTFADGRDVMHKEEFADLLTNNFVARDALTPIIVAASKWHQQAHEQAAAASSKKLENAFGRLQALERQNAAVRGLQPTPVDASTYSAPYSAPPPQAAPPPPQWTTAAQPVTVSASRFTIPAILQNLPSYGEVGMGRSFYGDVPGMTKAEK
jgi:hypothetical protein